MNIIRYTGDNFLSVYCFVGNNEPVIDNSRIEEYWWDYTQSVKRQGFSFKNFGRKLLAKQNDVLVKIFNFIIVF